MKVLVIKNVFLYVCPHLLNKNRKNLVVIDWSNIYIFRNINTSNTVNFGYRGVESFVLFYILNLKKSYRKLYWVWNWSSRFPLSRLIPREYMLNVRDSIFRQLFAKSLIESWEYQELVKYRLVVTAAMCVCCVSVYSDPGTKWNWF